tara:strand:- start:530 stop:655 length:126 start_codon:yes stop_codon:yes gene_type:complete
MARIVKKILKCGLHSYTAEIRLIGFPHTNRSFGSSFGMEGY